MLSGAVWGLGTEGDAPIKTLFTVSAAQLALGAKTLAILGAIMSGGHPAKKSVRRLASEVPGQITDVRNYPAQPHRHKAFRR